MKKFVKLWLHDYNLTLFFLDLRLRTFGWPLDVQKGDDGHLKILHIQIVGIWYGTVIFEKKNF